MSEALPPSRERTPAEARSLRQAAQLVTAREEAAVEQDRGPEEVRSMRLAAGLLTIHLLLGSIHYFLTESHPPALIWFALPMILAVALYTLNSCIQVIVVGLIVLACGGGPVFYFLTLPREAAALQVLALWGGELPVLLLLLGPQSPARRIVAVVIFLLFTGSVFGVRVFSASGGS